jgi:hypothetical protein
MMATLAAAEDPPFLAVKALLLNPENPEHGITVSIRWSHCWIAILDCHSLYWMETG